MDIILKYKDYLLENYTADENGNIYFKKSGKKVNESLNSEGYFLVRAYIDKKGVNFRYHRIIYFLLTREIPKYLDHKDGDKKNNKLDNLRPATKSDNGCNRKVQTNNKLQIKNILEWTNKGTTYYIIRIRKDEKTINKYFNKSKFTIDQVIEERDRLLKDLHGEFANLDK